MHKPPTSTSLLRLPYSCHIRDRAHPSAASFGLPAAVIARLLDIQHQNVAASMMAQVPSDSNDVGISLPSHALGSPASAALQIMSDLHFETPKFLPMYNEFQIEPRAKYPALLGDIGIAGDDSLFDFVTRQLSQFEVVFYVLGNHEPYPSRCEDAVARMEAFERLIASRKVLEQQQNENGHFSLGRFVFLNRRRFDLLSKVTILGCTLFSHISDEQRSTVSLFVSDFSNFADWSVDRHNAAHQADLDWLNAEVETIARDEPQRSIVVLTHYSPTAAPEANDPEHVEDSRGVQSAFVTDLQKEPCWMSTSVKVWAFGHTHYNCDFFDGTTGKLVVANQRGYGREDIFNFDSEKTIGIV
ncbi:hypothetical protein INS49_002245 [Diaporthe citri]|uniref:uncharacterized protein n=1 Tax=Diaporthe citri TaxID=83186 RepID=UPI001C8235E2|nr:uncharacterized protein INS49_002245 [Diaporthe citri]KAG6368045.1 hypothetical protein INS49_002245 [Diaporthe citri]